MLKAMGWKQGDGLGKSGSGIKEPVKVLGVSNNSFTCALQAEMMAERAGLGSGQKPTEPLAPGQTYADGSFSPCVRFC